MAVQRQTTVLIVVLIVLSLLPTDVGAFTNMPAGFIDEPVVSDVPTPTAIAWLPLPTGDLLITSQGGRLYRSTGGGPAAVALNLSSVTCSNSEMGLLGIAVDPNFASGNRFIYLYYTHRQSGNCANRVSRFSLDVNGIVASSEQVLIDNIPAPGGNHNAGDLQFGHDGFLYVAVGDGGADLQTGDGGAQNANARRLDLLNGKILRITRDGGIPSGNPYQGNGTSQCAQSGGAQIVSKSRHAKNVKTKADRGKKGGHRKHNHRHRHRHKKPNQNPPGENPPDQNPPPVISGPICQEIFATGLRNPFRIAFDPDDNTEPQRFYINDVGQNSWEEIDDGHAGADYGWNIREGPCPTGTTSSCTPDSRFSEPVYAYGRSAGCVTITGGAFVPNSNNWPGTYDDVYLFADYGCRTIFVLRNETVGQTPVMFGIGTAATSLAFGPDGNLYYTDYEGGQVHRIRYNGNP
jgi:glucose/arabinose dehydrogenase